MIKSLFPTSELKQAMQAVGSDIDEWDIEYNHEDCAWDEETKTLYMTGLTLASIRKFVTQVGENTSYLPVNPADLEALLKVSANLVKEKKHFKRYGFCSKRFQETHGQDLMTQFFNQGYRFDLGALVARRVEEQAQRAEPKEPEASGPPTLSVVPK